MKTLFDFQHDFLRNIGRAFKTNKRVIGQAHPGFGKTITFVEIARRSIAKGNVVCIAVHRIELFQQTFDQLRSFGIIPSLIMPGSHPMPGAQVYLSMVETFCRRMDKGLVDKLNINFFILDECHIGSYHKLIKQLDCHILGFTGTPKSTGSPELKDYYDDIVCGIGVEELIKIGRLVPARTFSIAHDFSHVKKKGKDFDDVALMKEFKTPKLHHGAVDIYEREAKGLKALCYCVSVEHSNQTVLQFRERGIKAAHVDGTTDAETRKRLFDWLRDGTIDVLSNVGIATVGTDIPEVECVIKNFASMSLVKDCQVNGRGARAHEGKKEFVIIDMGRNYLRHGCFGEHIDWKHIFNHPAEAFKKESKSKSKRECDDCGMLMKFTSQTCPNCGSFTSKQHIEKKMLTGCSIEEVREYKMKHLPPHLRIPVENMNYQDLCDYAQHLNYSPRWVHVMVNLKKNRR